MPKIKIKRKLDNIGSHNCSVRKEIPRGKGTTLDGNLVKRLKFHIYKNMIVQVVEVA